PASCAPSSAPWRRNEDIRWRSSCRRFDGPSRRQDAIEPEGRSMFQPASRGPSNATMLTIPRPTGGRRQGHERLSQGARGTAHPAAVAPQPPLCNISLSGSRKRLVSSRGSEEGENNMNTRKLSLILILGGAAVMLLSVVWFFSAYAEV